MEEIKMSKRGQIQKKTTIQEIENLVQSRNHQLLQYQSSQIDPNTVPQQSRISLRCLTCGYEWSTKLQVYLSRISKNKGCRKCFEKNIQNPEIYPNTPFIQKPDVIGRPKRREGKEKQRQAHLNGGFGFIRNRNDLIQYLKEQPNKHNNYALELVLRDDERKRNKVTLSKGESSRHHVLPLHAQGSPDNWNIISVTKKEHDKLHRLRYEIYQEEADLKSDFCDSF